MNPTYATPPARPGDWWESASGAIYLVIKPEFTSRARGACVRAFWITGHTPPQVQEVRLALPVYRSVTTKGKRLTSPPTRNHRGALVTAQVEVALARLAALREAP